MDKLFLYKKAILTFNFIIPFTGGLTSGSIISASLENLFSFAVCLQQVPTYYCKGKSESGY